MGTIQSNTMDLRAGSGTISLTHSTFPNTTMEVEKISSMDFEFDIEDLKEKADTVFFGPSGMTFTAFEGLANGGSLFTEIDAVTSTDEIETKLEWTTNGGRSFTTVYYFKPTDANYNRLKRSLDIETTFQFYGRAPLDLDEYLSDSSVVNPDHYTKVEDFLNDAGNTPSCMDPETFIDAVLGDINPTNTNIVSSFSFTNPKGGGDTWVLPRQGAGDFDPIVDATVALYRLAAMDGAVLGSGMGYNFFINRLDTTNDVTIKEDDAELLDIELTNKNYSSVITLFAHTLGGTSKKWASWSATYGNTLNPEASKSLIVFFFMIEMDAAVWDGAKYIDDGVNSIISAPQYSLDEDAKEGDYTVYVNNTDYTAGDLVSFHTDIADEFIPQGKNAYIISGGTSSTTDLVNALNSNEKKDTTDNSNHLVTWINNRRSTYADNTNLCYQKAFGADGSRKITITVFGIDTIKPYQTFTLDSSYPASIATKTFRPSRMSYDLHKDAIKIDAYEI